MRDVKKSIEEAKKAGVDMSWLEEAEQRHVSPEHEGVPSQSAALLSAVRQQTGTARKMYQPRMPGTPTEAKRQYDVGIEQQELGRDWEREQWDWETQLAREQWDWEKQMKEEQWAWDQKWQQKEYDQKQSAINASSASSASSLPGGRDATLTERDRLYYSQAGRDLIRDIEENPSMPLEQFRVNALNQRPLLIEDGIELNEFLDFINEQYYLYHYGQAYQAVRDPDMSWPHGQDLRQHTWMYDEYYPSVKKPDRDRTQISPEDAQWYAERSMGRYTVEEIMRAAETDQLDFVLRDILGTYQGAED